MTKPFDPRLPTCCQDMDIRPEDLLFPERMSADGQAFVTVHGLARMTLTELQQAVRPAGDGLAHLVHRCPMLMDDGECSIYMHRPAICRDFDCKRRSDCACGGTGRFAFNDPPK